MMVSVRGNGTCKKEVYSTAQWRSDDLDQGACGRHLDNRIDVDGMIRLRKWFAAGGSEGPAHSVYRQSNSEKRGTRFLHPYEIRNFVNNGFETSDCAYPPSWETPKFDVMRLGKEFSTKSMDCGQLGLRRSSDSGGDLARRKNVAFASKRTHFCDCPKQFHRSARVVNKSKNFGGKNKYSERVRVNFASGRSSPSDSALVSAIINATSTKMAKKEKSYNPAQEQRTFPLPQYSVLISRQKG